MSGDKKATVLPTDSAARKKVPLCRGLLDYFPAALAAVAEVSRIGNEKHNPGEPMHHAREKSSDHADCIVRHLTERGGFDEFDLPSGEHVRVRHSAEMAWRALALLQEELEAAGEAPLARGAVLPGFARPPEPEPACQSSCAIQGCLGHFARPPEPEPACQLSCAMQGCSGHAVPGSFLGMYCEAHAGLDR